MSAPRGRDRRMAQVGIAAAIALGAAAVAVVALALPRLADAVAANPLAAAAVVAIGAFTVLHEIADVTDEESTFTLDEVALAFGLMTLGPLAAVLFVATTALSQPLLDRFARRIFAHRPQPARIRAVKWAVNQTGFAVAAATAAGIVYGATALLGDTTPVRAGAVLLAMPTANAAAGVLVSAAQSYVTRAGTQSAGLRLRAMAWATRAGAVGTVLAVAAGDSAWMTVGAAAAAIWFVDATQRFSRESADHAALDSLMAATAEVEGTMPFDAVAERVTDAARHLLACDYAAIRDAPPDASVGEVGELLHEEPGGTQLWLVVGARRGPKEFGPYERDRLRGIARLAVPSVHAEALARVNDELERATVMKDEFLSTVSHELRTPLAAIRGYTHIMKKRWDRMGDDDRLKYLDIIERQSLRQERLVEGLLAVSSIIAGRIDPSPHPVAVGQLIAHAEESTGMDVEVRGDPTATVMADPSHLEQVFTNLLTNVSKYGAPPIVATIERGDGDVALHITDSGPGIPAELVPQLFDRFTQGDHGSRRTSSGVGLGLAIVRDLVEANGGSVSYSQRDGEGATFTVRVPAADPSDAAAVPAGSGPGGAATQQRRSGGGPTA